MRFRAGLRVFSGDHTVAKSFSSCFLMGLAMLSLAATAQVAPPTALASNPSPVSALVGGTTWLSLTKAQQIALMPLAKPWDGLSEGQKRKWLAMAKTYPELGVTDQEKMHSRMVEWAALSPKDRELARLNFAQTKSIAKSERAANWEAYQALTPDERQKLAEGAKIKPVGAAVAVKPVAADKLATVPVTRHTPEPERAAAVAQRPINRNTLLPQLPASAAVSGALAVPSKP